MSIRNQFVFLASGVLLVGIFTLLIIQTLVLRDDFYGPGEKDIENMSRILTLEARNTVTAAQATAQAAADAMTSLSDAGIEDRDVYAEVMSRFVGKNKQLAGGGLIMEPDALGKDADHVDEEISNEDGRLAAYFYNDGNEVGVTGLKLDRDSGYQEWYEKAKALNRGRISAPYVESGDDATKLWITATAPVLDQSDTFIGAVTVNFSLNALQEIFEQRMSSQNATAALLDENGKWLSHSNRELYGEKVDQVVRDKLKVMISDMISSSDKRTVRYSENGVINAVEILNLNDIGQRWFVMVAAQEDDLFAAAKKITRISFGIALAIIAIGAGVFWIFGSRIAAPIRRLTDSVKQVIAGDTETPVPCQERADEIGRLAGAIDDLRRKDVPPL